MCVILYKPKKTMLPSEKILKNCYNNNHDGVGYTYTHRNKVIIRKGYTDFNTFYKDLIKDYKKYNLQYHNLLIHFRIGTSGGLAPEKTHPFKITSNVHELNKLYIKNKKTAVLHNGILSSYTYNTELSDTQNYIKDFLTPLLKSKIRNKNELIKESLDYSKLAMLDNKDNVYLYGDYIKDNGIYYSNKSYNNYITNENIKEFTFINRYRKQKQKSYTTIWSYNYNER